MWEKSKFFDLKPGCNAECVEKSIKVGWDGLDEGYLLK